MAKVTLARLGGLLREKRGERGIREAAKEIGVSPATLSRVERGYTPDLATFGKICRWLRLNPAEVLGVQEFQSAVSGHGPAVVTAHFRGARTPSPSLASAFAQLILAARNEISRDINED